MYGGGRSRRDGYVTGRGVIVTADVTGRGVIVTLTADVSRQYCDARCGCLFVGW